MDEWRAVRLVVPPEKILDQALPSRTTSKVVINWFRRSVGWTEPQLERDGSAVGDGVRTLVKRGVELCLGPLIVPDRTGHPDPCPVGHQRLPPAPVSK